MMVDIVSVKNFMIEFPELIKVLNKENKLKTNSTFFIEFVYSRNSLKNQFFTAQSSSEFKFKIDPENKPLSKYKEKKGKVKFIIEETIIKENTNNEPPKTSFKGIKMGGLVLILGGFLALFIYIAFFANNDKLKTSTMS